MLLPSPVRASGTWAQFPSLLPGMATWLLARQQLLSPRFPGLRVWLSDGGVGSGSQAPARLDLDQPLWLPGQLISMWLG